MNEGGRPTTSTISDAALVDMIRAGRGRAAAEAELGARFRRRVYLYGLKHLRNASDADDLAHDVLATVIERVREGAMTEPEKLASFVLGVSRMIVANQRRGEARKVQILARYRDPLTAHPEDPDARSAASIHLSRVRDCLGSLADRDRTVLLLSFYAELDAEALGRELGAEPSHIRVIRHRALGRLRACVAGAGEGEP